jgi:hypothetical protein
VIRRLTLGTGAALAVIGSAAFLVSGHPSLNWPEDGLPLGTIAAGVLVTGLGALPLAIAPRPGFAQTLGRGLFLLAAAWLPVSLMLAGNWRLNFESGPRSEWALALSALTLAAIVAGGVLSVAARLASLRGKRAPAQP